MIFFKKKDKFCETKQQIPVMLIKNINLSKVLIKNSFFLLNFDSHLNEHL